MEHDIEHPVEPVLKSALAVETIRSVNGSDTIDDAIRDFLSSSWEPPDVLAKAIRRHWQIENSLH